MTKKKTAQKKSAVKKVARRTSSNVVRRVEHASFDDLPDPSEVRAARECLERAAAAYAADLAALDANHDMLTQRHLAVAREVEAAGSVSNAFVSAFKVAALSFRPRVEQRAEAIVDDPLNPPLDLPVEPGPFTICYKRMAGRATIAWREKAKELRILCARKIERIKSFGEEDAEAWAKQETETAPRGEPTYTPQIEVRA